MTVPVIGQTWHMKILVSDLDQDRNDIDTLLFLPPPQKSKLFFTLQHTLEGILNLAFNMYTGKSRFSVYSQIR